MESDVSASLSAAFRVVVKLEEEKWSGYRRGREKREEKRGGVDVSRGNIGKKKSTTAFSQLNRNGNPRKASPKPL